MNGIMFIFSDLLQLTGCDPWQALVEWDQFKRADNARIRAAKRRRMERTAH